MYHPSSGLALVLLAWAPAGAQNPTGGQQATCRFTEVPVIAVEGGEAQVGVEYLVPEALGTVALRCELKDPNNEVLTSLRREVRGQGTERFTFTVPAAADAPQLLFAAWMGEVWTESRCPIVHSRQVSVMTKEAFAVRQGEERQAEELLAARGYRRREGGNVAVLADAALATDLEAAEAVAGSVRAASRAAVTTLDAPAISNPFVVSPEHFDLLVILGARRLPARAIGAVQQYVLQGGRLIATGMPAFEQPLHPLDGRWVTEEELLDELAATPPQRVVWDFGTEDLARWARQGNTLGSPATAASATGHDGQQNALHVRIANLQGWDTIASPPPAEPIPADHRLTCFWAKGGPRTTALALEWREQDGSRWIATVPLGTEWRHYALLPEQFRYWQDSASQGRGGPGDSLHLAQARQLVVGLAQTHTQGLAGEQEYWLEEVGTAPGTGTVERTQVAPLDGLCPRYKFAPVTNARRWRFSPLQVLLQEDAPELRGDVVSSHPRPQGTGYGKLRQFRWMPLLETLDGDGEVCGTPGVLILNPLPAPQGAMVATFGLSEGPVRELAQSGALGELAAWMLRGVFLSEGGSQFYAYFPGEEVRLGATVANLGHWPANALRPRLRVLAEPGGQSLWEHEAELSVAAGESRAVETTWRPARFDRDSYQVVVELVADGKVMDRLEHELGVWNPPAQPEFTVARDGDFYRHGRKWYPHGVNYMPSSGVAMEDGEYFEYWFDPQPYDPVVVDRDLQRIAAAGMNMVSVFCYHRSCHSRNLVDLLRRCEKHGLAVNLSLRPGTPLEFRGDEMRELVEANRLAESDNLFAYDLAWEPAWWNYANRKRWDGEWERWIVERYGSIESAERDWSCAVPRTPEGQVTSPGDDLVSTDGGHRVMVAAYRRCLDDLLSRTHGEAVRLMRTVDPRHLISFRMTIAGDPTAGPASMAYDFHGLAKSMDIMCPEGYGRGDGWEGVKPGFFTAAYARHAAPRAPVMWAEFGRSIWNGARMESDPMAAEGAGRYYDDFCRMALESGANGTVCWWYPGGFRVGENSDFGIINADGSWRPQTDAIHRWADRMTRERPRRQADVPIMMDRDADARGLYGIYLATQEAYWRAIEQGRFPYLVTAGDGTDSATTPLLAVGNVPYNGSNPPKYLNAEFSRLEVLNADGVWERAEDGREIVVAADAPVRARASVGNTGAAKWLAGTGPGTVALSCREPSELRFEAPIPEDVPYLGDAELGEFTLADRIAAPTRVVFEMTARDRMWFGEKVEVVLRPGD